MDRIGNEKGKLRFVVLPLQPETADAYNGVGLTLHFLLGNTIVLNTNLKEFWFGWRTKKLFPNRGDLTTYLLGRNKPLDFKRFHEEQGGGPLLGLPGGRGSRTGCGQGSAEND